MFVKVKLDVTDKQLKSLMGGKTVLLKHSQLGAGDTWFSLHPSTVSRIQKAMRNGKGVRIMVTAPELEHSGEGIKDVLKKISNAYQRVKPIVAPYIKKGVERAADYGVSLAKTAAPLFSDEIDSVSKKVLPGAIDKLGKVTGAYGMQGGKAGRGRKRVAPRMMLSDSDTEYYAPGVLHNQSNFLSPLNPAMNPVMANLPDPGSYQPADVPLPEETGVVRRRRGPRVARKHGGSFKLAGGRMT